MKFLLNIVICSLCVALTLSDKNTYKAAVVGPNSSVEADRFASIINEAAKSNVDILVLPSLQASASETPDQDYYDEAVKTISSAAKQGGLYVVAHLLEKALCQNRRELVRSNLVFNRQGDIVSEYRKPVNNVANCTSGTAADLSSFTTDFGVTFGVLMEEDIVLQTLERARKLKNFVVAGAWSSEIPFLSTSQFSSSWAYVTNANLISSAGIFAGSTGPTATGAGVVVAELKNDGGFDKPIAAPVVNPTKLAFPGEDLSQYMIRPLDIEASIRGYTETVCHRKFCCEFKVKTKSIGSTQNELSYGLAVFDGVRHFGGGHNIGAQTCAVVACAGLYKRSCLIGTANNSTNTNFEKITVTANFTRANSEQFPVILTADGSPAEFKFVREPVTQSKTVTSEITDCQNLLSFGIFGRDFGKDFDDFVFGKDNDAEGLTSDIYDYLYGEDMQQFFDYVWIRLRVMIVIVSVYVLEMM